MTSHTLAMMTTATTKYERWGLKKRRKRKDEGQGTRDEGECENNDDKNENVGDFVKRHCTIMYYLLVEYQTLPYSLDQKLKNFFVNLQLKMIANKVNLED